MQLVLDGQYTMNTEVKANDQPRYFRKSVVVPFILIVTMLTFYFIERSSVLRQTASSHEAPPFKIFQSPTRIETSPLPVWGKSHTVGKDGGQPEPFVFPNYHNHLPNAYIHPSNDSIYKKSILVFVHNPKSGGTTIKTCMTRLLPHKPALIFSKTARKSREDLLNGNAPLEPYYMGDSTLGICDYGPFRPCSYFTMLREPYERVVSNYYFCQDGGNSCSPSNKSLEEFVLSKCSLFFQQLTVRFSCHEYEDENCRRSQVCPTLWHCNSIHASSYIPRDQRHFLLQYVIDHLDTTFAVIGLLDEYESSLELFEDAFGINFVDKCRTLHHNSGKYLYREKHSTDGEKQSRRMLIETAVKRLRENETVRECLSEDEKIYKKATEIFQIQKRELLKRNSWKSKNITLQT